MPGQESDFLANNVFQKIFKLYQPPLDAFAVKPSAVKAVLLVTGTGRSSDVPKMISAFTCIYHSSKMFKVAACKLKCQT